MSHALTKGDFKMKRVAMCFFISVTFCLSLTAESAYTQQISPPAASQSSPTPKAKFVEKTNAIPGKYILVLNDDVAPDYLSREAHLERVTAIAARHAQAHNGKSDYIYETALKGYAIELPTEAGAIAISELPEVEFVAQDAMAEWDWVGLRNSLAGKAEKKSFSASSVSRLQNSYGDVVPLHISSFNTPFAMQGDFEGEYRVYPGRIEVRLTKTDIRISEHCPYKGRRLLSAIALSLATSTDDTEVNKWKIVYPGQSHPLNRVMSAGDTASLGELYFTIPFDKATDLSKYWMVIKMTDTSLDVSLDAPKEERMMGYAFAHSCRDIFSKPK